LISLAKALLRLLVIVRLLLRFPFVSQLPGIGVTRMQRVRERPVALEGCHIGYKPSFDLIRHTKQNGQRSQFSITSALHTKQVITASWLSILDKFRRSTEGQ
jgi:hypothetical protein